MTDNRHVCVVDLTQDDSMILVDHSFLTNSVILLEDSLRESPLRDRTNTVQNTKSTNKQKKSISLKKTFSEQSPKNNRGINIGDCPICFDVLGVTPLASTKCGHVFCLSCLEELLKRKKRCPTCRCVLKGSSAYHPLYI